MESDSKKTEELEKKRLEKEEERRKALEEWHNNKLNSPLIPRASRWHCSSKEK
jgi:hypothetical protein